MKGLIILVAALAALVHGYFYLSFGSFDPCKAAALRIVSQQSGEAARALGQLVAGPIENRLRAKGTLTCYRAAFDKNPQALLQ
jgi:hypothetical protein